LGIRNVHTLRESVEITRAGFLVGRSWLVPHFLFLGAPLSGSGAAAEPCFLIFNFRPTSTFGGSWWFAGLWWPSVLSGVLLLSDLEVDLIKLKDELSKRC